MSKEETKQTSKKNTKEIILAGQTEIYQSNRITNGRFVGFTLIQSRILISIIKHLQDAVKKSMNSDDYTQLALFREDSDSIMMGITLSEIASPKQYKEVAEAAEGLMNLKIKLKSPIGKDYVSIASLVNRIEKPRLTNGKSILYFKMDKDVASKLIEVDKNNKGVPIHYTKYFYEVAIKARCKYTYKLYWLISSWKTKGGFYITLDELRTSLGLNPDEYLVFSQFKRRVLLPAQKELMETSDCWFNCSAPDFEMRDGKKVTSLYFKVITRGIKEDLLSKIIHLQGMLRLHFRFTDSHINQLNPLFTEGFTYEKYELFQNKLLDLNNYISGVRNTDKRVNDIASYTLSSLLKAFSQ
jgi:hypothetical protein